MRSITNIRLFSDEFSDITGESIYQGFCKSDNKTYDFSWPITEKSPIDHTNVIIPFARLTESKYIAKAA